MASIRPASLEVIAVSEARSPHVEETISFVATLARDDRITVVRRRQSGIRSWREGMIYELLKSEAEMLEELEQRRSERRSPIVPVSSPSAVKSTALGRGMRATGAIVIAVLHRRGHENGALVGGAFPVRLETTRPA